MSDDRSLPDANGIQEIIRSRTAAREGNAPALHVRGPVVTQRWSRVFRGDGGAYTASTESGEPIIDQSGQGIVGSSTEASNTDISEEFTKLIVTQQAYSANTKIVTAADEMLREALSMIR